MVDRSDKSPSPRQDRQLRPVLNSIIFLIAANLVAKGALGLGTFQAPPIPGNIQGSLFLSLNQPSKTPQQLGQQFLPVWFPVANQINPSSTQQPIAQTQIVNIGEPYEEIEELQAKGLYDHRMYVNRYNSIEDPLESASSEEVEMKLPPDATTTEVNTEEPTTINTEVEILPENTTNLDPNLQEVARQATPGTNITSTTTTTTAPTTTPAISTTTAKPPVEGAPNDPGNTTATNGTMSNTIFGYGPPNNFGTIGLAYGPPGVNGSLNGTNSTTTGPGYSYFPAGNYGPFTGNENISITYGPPGPPFYQRPYYQKPFLSSPEDPYLNSYNHQYYNNFYNGPTGYSNMYKYTDFFKNFYSKFDYNNYPSFYSNNNYLGK